MFGVLQCQIIPGPSKTEALVLTHINGLCPAALNVGTFNESGTESLLLEESRRFENCITGLQGIIWRGSDQMRVE